MRSVTCACAELYFGPGLISLVMMVTAAAAAAAAAALAGRLPRPTHPSLHPTRHYEAFAPVCGAAAAGFWLDSKRPQEHSPHPLTG
jgi:hypothetical protein